MNESKEKKTSIKTKKNIIASIKDETDDIGEYSKAATMARKSGDTRAHRLFKHLEKQERHHRRELKELKEKY